MAFVAILGCDGSGKSAVIQELCACLSEEGCAVTRWHWAPEPFGNTGGAGADDPHGRTPRGMVGSTVKLGWLWLRWWVAWFGTLRRQSRVGQVVFDRYHGDLLVDPLRYRYGGPLAIAHWFSALMPQPDLVVLLDASPVVLLARKQEVTPEVLTDLRDRYLRFCRQLPQGVVVDAAQPLAQVVEEVRTAIKGVAMVRS